MNANGNYAIFMFQSDLEFPKTERNRKLPMEFSKCGIADKVSKVLIFENAYFWVTFSKSFIFCIYIYGHIFGPFQEIFNAHVAKWTCKDY